MRTILEVLLSLLAVVGLLGLGWLGFGRMLIPAGGEDLRVILPGRGEGEGLEQALAGLLWLKGSGLLGGRIVIVDCGLSAAGLTLAQALCRREAGVELWDREDGKTYW